jgi:hypothetical protein
MPDSIIRAVTSSGDVMPRRSIHSKNFPAVYLQNASVEGRSSSPGVAAFGDKKYRHI